MTTPVPLTEVSDEVFVRTLRNSGLSNVEAALHLRVSIPTIRRWRNNRNLPYQALRPAFVRKIEIEALYKVLSKEYPSQPNQSQGETN